MLFDWQVLGLGEELQFASRVHQASVYVQLGGARRPIC